MARLVMVCTATWILDAGLAINIHKKMPMSISTDMHTMYTHPKPFSRLRTLDPAFLPYDTCVHGQHETSTQWRRDIQINPADVCVLSHITALFVREILIKQP